MAAIMSPQPTSTIPTDSHAPTTEPTPAVSLEAYDEEQVRLMEERCILVDEQDKAYGEGSKKECEW
jgi:isopentenyl-diphosphate delta-isomerase